MRFWEKYRKGAPSVMGRLSKVWLKLENAKKSDARPLSLEEILSLVEQTICLLGQTSNSASYRRSQKFISNMCFPQEAKITLKNKVELLQTNDENLFGKEVSNHLTESVKSKKSSKEVFLKLDNNQKLFRSGLSFQQQQRKSGGQKQSLRVIEAIKENKIGAGTVKARVLKVVVEDLKVKTSPTRLFLDTSPLI